MKRLMIVDGNNDFVRHYIVNPSLSTNGQPVGGIVGFLQSLQKLDRSIKPDSIVVVWDGAGGSKKRKSLVKTYKEGRKPIRLNRNVRNLEANEETDNRIWQQVRILEYLNKTPVIQFMKPDIEADDIVAFVSMLPRFSEWQKVIVSSDKDFIQLCDDNTVLFRPIQKEVLNKKTIISDFSISPTNFALARAMVGDKSDNLPGVPGVGLATAAKRLPFLVEEKSYFIEDVMNYCQKKVDEDTNIRFYSSILEHEDVVNLNYKMMQLYSPSLSTQAVRSIRESLEKHEPEFSETEVVKMLFQDGFPQINLDELYATFRKIIREHKESS
ncbi:hypothetical protein DRO91_07855 [Candidatus Heimdallarchaeota archaeon]|nr:MAG: hypothetical protein DRO91_07855 [Candidatus Heimdallarchaeota archaeon]